MKFGSRIFSPRPFTTVLTFGIVSALLLLGRWQLQRADQKTALYEAFDRGTDATRTIDSQTPPLRRFQHIEATGTYDDSRQILIDNMTNAKGGAGYFVITPLELSDGGWILVNRGWIALGASRAALPLVAVSRIARQVRGRADRLPSAGIKMGKPNPLAPPFPIVANFPDRFEIERLLHETSWARAADLVLLDADQPDGYTRQWQAPGLPPMRHLAYAVQWFALAFALLAIWVVTNTRRDAKDPA